MLDLLDRNGIDFDAAGGLTMGADPVGHAIMRTAGDNDRAIDTFVVRKAQKSYGMGRQVEGPEVSGRNVASRSASTAVSADPPVVEVSSRTTTFRPETSGPSTWRPIP